MTALLNEVQPAFGSRRQSAGRQLVCGVDTHQDTHTAAAVDVTGQLLGTETFPPVYTKLLRLMKAARLP